MYWFVQSVRILISGIPYGSELRKLRRGKYGCLDHMDESERIISETGFKYRKFNDGGKFLMQRSDLVAVG
jgi:hypothetical protein